MFPTKLTQLRLKVKWFIGLLAGGFTLIIFFSCYPNGGTQNSSDHPLVIGSFLSLTGPDASFGRSTLNGIELAISQINANGGLQGRKLSLDIRDDQGKTENAIRAISELARNPNTLAIIGQAASRLSLAAAPVAQKMAIPMVSPSSTHPRVTEAGDFIFRVCFIDPFQGYVMAKFARENLKISRVAILRDRRSDYSTGLAEYFHRTFRSLGGEIVAREEFLSGDVDFTHQITEIQKHHPEAIFIPGYYTEVAQIAQQIKKMGGHYQLLGGDGWDSGKLFELARDAVDGAYFSSHFAPENNVPAVRKFVVHYQRQFHQIPDSFAAMAFDATMIVAQAIAHTHPLSRVRLRNAIAETRGFSGVTGIISINTSRNADKPAVIFKAEGATHRFITTINPN